MNTMAFEIGYKVRWTSQTRGCKTVKRGVVVGVCPPYPEPVGGSIWTDSLADAALALGLKYIDYVYMFDGWRGKTVRYFVVVKKPNSNAKPKLYCPYMTWLELDV